MLGAVEEWIVRSRRLRGPTLAVVNLRFLVGFAFVPAGLKKVLGQPFTDPGKEGAFYDFLHAFHATGGFYRFVGVLQLVAATLLLTQQFAALGAVIMLPIVSAILVFCWSTGVVPTAVVVTLIWLAVAGLLVWDFDLRRGAYRGTPEPGPPPVELTRWRRCGLAMLAIYGAACVLDGRVYRPRGLELSDPRFYVFPAIMLLPLLTLILDRREARGAKRKRQAGRL